MLHVMSDLKTRCRCKVRLRKHTVYVLSHSFKIKSDKIDEPKSLFCFVFVAYKAACELHPFAFTLKNKGAALVFIGSAQILWILMFQQISLLVSGLFKTAVHIRYSKEQQIKGFCGA